MKHGGIVDNFFPSLEKQSFPQRLHMFSTELSAAFQPPFAIHPVKTWINRL